MAIEYKGYKIVTWIDDDTNHAQMLKGRKGPERLYVDIDLIAGGDERLPSSKRFGTDILTKHDFSGTEAEQLVEVAKLWIDAPTLFVMPSSPIAENFLRSKERANVILTRKP